MNYELQGKLIVINDPIQVSERFKKRDFVVESDDGFYKQYIKFQLTQEKCALIDDFSVGDDVNVKFNLKGRPYEKNGETIYFTNLEAWRITEGREAGAAANQPANDAAAGFGAPAGAPAQSAPSPTAADEDTSSNFTASDDELPF